MGKPCIKEACELWVIDGQKEDKEIKEKGYCSIVYIALNSFNQLGQAMNVQASIESLRNETVQSHKNVLNVSNVMRLQNKEKELLEGDNG